MADLRPDPTQEAIYGKTMDFSREVRVSVLHLRKNTSFSWTLGSF